jgi:hypothetical protein
MDQDAHRFMWTAVCLQKGIDFEQMDALRSVVNGTSKFSILGGAHMKSKFVELVLDWERNNVRNEVKGKLFSWFHDSGTRGKSCLAMVVRFISRSSETGLLQQNMRLFRLKFLAESSTALRLAGDQATGLGSAGLDVTNAIYAGCDGCATNKAAMGVLQEQYHGVMFGLCVSHLGANTGGKFVAPELDKFFKDFIAVCNHSGRLREKWRIITGRKWIGYGGVRWFNRHGHLLCGDGRLEHHFWNAFSHDQSHI